MHSSDFDERDRDMELLISDIRSGRYSLMLERVNLAHATQDCLLEVAPDASKAGVELVHLVPTDLEVPRVDRRAVRLMLEGLVRNGIELTQGGGKVTVTAGGRLPSLWVGVIDTGVVIEPDKLVWLSRSYREQKDMCSAIEGRAALRLTLARALVELQGGAFE